jgi:nucleotide-binding universal stress UspA family protein
MKNLSPKRRKKDFRIRDILVPVDFSEMSIQAIRTAQVLEERFGAKVHLTNVHEYYYPAGFLAPTAPVAFSPATYIDEVRIAAASRLKDLAAKHKLTGSCYAEIGGPVYNEICLVARQIPADLIVTPTHSHGGLKRILLGSTAERLVQHSSCPVLVARDKRARGRSTEKAQPLETIETILVPVDFSPQSFEGLRYAIRFAEKMSAKIVVLSVVYFGPAYTADGYAMYDLAPLKETARKAAEGQMKVFLKKARFGAVRFESEVKVGFPVNEICAFAEDRDIDLIITPTHGFTGFKHVLIGSTAEKVVRRAPCSVLVVPSHPQHRAKQIVRGSHKVARERAHAGRKQLRAHAAKSGGKRQTPPENDSSSLILKGAVLLVDADGDCEETVSIAAGLLHLLVLHVKTSREAFPLLTQHIHDLSALIVDVDPGAHGIALLEAIDGCAERPPMLVLTSLEEAYMQPIAEKHGALFCLAKPLSVTKVRSTLENTLLRRHTTSDVWGHPGSPPADRGLKVKASSRGIYRKLSAAAN